MSYGYKLESFYLGKWVCIKQGPKTYLEGFLDAYKDMDLETLSGLLEVTER